MYLLICQLLIKPTHTTIHYSPLQLQKWKKRKIQNAYLSVSPRYHAWECELSNLSQWRRRVGDDTHTEKISTSSFHNPIICSSAPLKEGCTGATPSFCFFLRRGQGHLDPTSNRKPAATNQRQRLSDVVAARGMGSATLAASARSAALRRSSCRWEWRVASGHQTDESRGAKARRLLSPPVEIGESAVHHQEPKSKCFVGEATRAHSFCSLSFWLPRFLVFSGCTSSSGTST